MAQFRAGDDEAFRVIHDRYRQRLFAYTRQMLCGSRQDAEDALQDVFVRAYGSLRSHDRDLALLALTCRITEGVIAVMSAVAKRALLSVATAAAGTSGPDAAAANALGCALLNVQGLTTLLGATVFAIGSTLFSYLFLRARTIPVSLGWLGVLASVLLVVGLPLQIAGFIEGPVTLLMWIPMGVFEVTFALWLLIKGVAPYPLPQPVAQ